MDFVWDHVEFKKSASYVSGNIQSSGASLAVVRIKVYRPRCRINLYRIGPEVI